MLEVKIKFYTWSKKWFNNLNLTLILLVSLDCINITLKELNSHK